MHEKFHVYTCIHTYIYIHVYIYIYIMCLCVDIRPPALWQVELVDESGNYLQQIRPQMGGRGPATFIGPKTTPSHT